MNINDLTPCCMMKNEEFWVYYSLRDILKVFGRAIILDTGSTDSTLDIIKEVSVGYDVKLIEENYGTDAVKIGNGRNVLREECPTHFLFLWDADELWCEDKLRKMLTYDINEGVDVVMVAGWNVQDVDNKLKLRTNDLANRDGLFSPNIRWNALSYPFEGYGLVENYISKGKGQYLPSKEVFAWHCRHTLRSSKNWETFFRKDKIGFYPYNGPFEDLPENWLGEINCKYPNPYLC